MRDGAHCFFFPDKIKGFGMIRLYVPGLDMNPTLISFFQYKEQFLHLVLYSDHMDFFYGFQGLNSLIDVQ